MSQRRPDIPRPLRRKVEMEAGHRCAIPTCKGHPVVIAHIVPYQTAQEHRFENLIALCPTCHARYDNGDIDQKSMRQYKANLALIAGRYSDLEQRVLKLFAEQPKLDHIDQPGGLQIFFYYLLQDGLLADAGMAPWATQIQGMNTYERYTLTEKGRQLIGRWMSAQELD